ncbi:MAG: hypothetical protein B6U97_02630 [Candidatus Altiarchaeales archaeon ex4484_96]|nr:MAG: hypothetical protein B6U97_02630 [Candidatus Altiarchaeales archaeon ex4484_96]
MTGGNNGFFLEYCIESTGKAGGGLHKINSRLHIDGCEGTAHLEKHCSSFEAPGEPIGFFKAKLPADVLSDIRGGVEAAGLDDLPPRTGEGPWSSIVTLKINEGVNRIKQVFSTGDMLIMDVLGDLLDSWIHLSCGWVIIH